MIGKTLAHYEVLSMLGKGGMGEVYRARDTRLGREVAIKVLPSEMSRDGERIARFQREARTLASLNHPNIAGLHGVEEQGGVRFLVMELAAGLDLSARIPQGPMPLGEVLAIAEQIAMALEEAHEKGIVHRDLKPANIKVSEEGTVKVLDFGLARAFQGAGVDEGDLGNSPTITAAMTQQGMILGTAAYMSPEQAKGKTVDRRADVWSYGVILWEMLTGRRLFQGDTTSEVLAGVLRMDVPWSTLPEETPPGVRRLLERCLERDPRERLRDIGEARIRLRRWAIDPSTMHDPNTSKIEAVGEERSMPSWTPWIVALLMALVAAGGWLLRGSETVPTSTAFRLAIELPEDDLLPRPGNGGVPLKLSPDGARLGYLTSGGLRLRRLDSEEVMLVDGSEGATEFVFSPDGQWVAYFTRDGLFRASVTGGAPIRVCDAEDPRGLAWVDENTLVFPPTFSDALHIVSLDTGVPRPLTSLDGSRSERSHRWPAPVFGGKAVLMSCQFMGKDYDESDIQIVWLESGERKTVYRGGSYPRYADTGHLLFVRSNSLFAIGFDPETGETSGQPVPILHDVASSVGGQESDNGSAHYDVSPQGTLVYRTQGSESGEMRLTYLDYTTGERTPLSDASPFISSFAVSPDRRWLAVARSTGAGSEIHLVDTRTGVERRFTNRDTIDLFLGTFSLDSRTLYWSMTSGDGKWWLVRQRLDGSARIDSIAPSGDTVAPTNLSTDGRYLFVTMWAGANGWDIGRVDLESDDPEIVNWIGGPGNQGGGSQSPDGRWIAYMAADVGPTQLHVRRWPDTGGVWQLTREDRRWQAPDWTADSRALIIGSNRGIHRIRWEEIDGLVEIGSTELLTTLDFEMPATFWNSIRSLPNGEGGYQLVPVDPSTSVASRTVLVTHWFDRLQAAMSGSPGGAP